MPLEQRTFTVVPPPGMPSKGPRPPMTSKQAKKLYKQATPRISRAELRRIEAAERERIKKEYEEERAAERAKATREKRQKKANEAKESRRKMGLPEPSRWVRASQRAITGFVNVRIGAKRTRDDVNGKIEDDLFKDTDEGLAGNGHSPGGGSIVKRVALARLGTAEESGFFQLSPQPDSLKPLGMEDFVRESKHKNSKATENRRILSTPQAPSQKPTKNANPRYGQHAFTLTEHLMAMSNAKLDTTLGENKLYVTPLRARPTPQRLMPQEHATETSSRPAGSDEILIGRPPKVTLARNTAQCCEKVGRGFRVPLGELRNMQPPPVPAISKPVVSPSSRVIQPNMELRKYSTAPNSSALTFLEANVDIFFPSPSQQVRELLEDIDDIPSNTQVAREIGVENKFDSATLGFWPSQLEHPVKPHQPSVRVLLSATALQSTIPPQLTNPSQKALSKIQQKNDDLGLEFLSSQDLEISSQDLRDINTPSRTVTPQLTQNGSQDSVSITIATRIHPKKAKLRFFEEKDEDLLHAAIHESLRATEKRLSRPNQRRSQRTQLRASPSECEYGDEDFAEVIEPELLAILERAEKSKRR